MKLYQPKFEELEYRKRLLSDADTMAYNAGFNLGIPEYNKDTGCIDFSKEKWKTWYECWIGNEPNRLYSYIMVDNQFVGEVALRNIESEEAHMISIIVDSRYRGRGYGKEALRLIMKVAFLDYKLGKLIDEFPVTRVSSKELFEKLGFNYVIDNGIIKFSMTKNEYVRLYKSDI